MPCPDTRDVKAGHAEKFDSSKYKKTLKNLPRLEKDLRYH
jgi:hypothetical protein